MRPSHTPANPPQAQKGKTGILYLIPVPLGTLGASGAGAVPDLALPQSTLEKARQLRHFVVENAKSARAFLKSLPCPVPIQTLQLAELNEHTPKEQLPELLRPLLEGNNLGLLSEAGCPAIADPGAELVAKAQEMEIRIIPMIGPSSLFLALMASGLNGQQFAFHGYLPVQEGERKKIIGQLEKESREKCQTQIFIETPYRNTALFTALIQHGHKNTRLCLATDLTLPTETIRTQTLGAWRSQRPAQLDRRPTVFLILA